MTSHSKNLGSAVVVAILLCVTLRQTCAVIALTLKLRYGISPSDVDAGVVDQRNVEQVMQWTAAGDR